MKIGLTWYFFVTISLSLQCQYDDILEPIVCVFEVNSTEYGFSLVKSIKTSCFEYVSERLHMFFYVKKIIQVILIRTTSFYERFKLNDFYQNAQNQIGRCKKIPKYFIRILLE